MNGKFLNMNFEMEGLGLKLKDGREILQNINGFIQSGRLTAVMGPSGAGKSTFLNVLSGKVNRSFGTLKISGKEVELSEYRKIYGFVPQDDVMHQEMTVRENILHSARIRLPATWTDEEIEEHTDTVIEALDLSHVAHSVIGDGIKRGISGGQRKRVNIGIELVACPLCLCLDEPTSGLDSTAALEVVDVLEKITQLGVTILSVIHQPRVEIFKKFHDVMLICPGGRTGYLGPTEGARPYFERLGYQFTDGSNEADILMDILSGMGTNPIHKYSVDELVEEWNKIAEELKNPMDDNPFTSSNSRIQSRRSSLRRGSAASIHSGYSGMSETATLLSRRSSDTPEACKHFHSEVGKMLQERGCTLLKQIYHCHNFSLLQQYRNFRFFVLELMVCAGAGLIMGTSMSSAEEVYVGVLVPPYSLLSGAPQFTLMLQFALLIAMAVGLAAAPAGVNVFSEELPVYWRKASSGHSPLAYYLGKTISTIPRVLLASLHFSAVLFYMSAMPYTYSILFNMIFWMFWGVYGICAFISMVIRRESATLLAVVIALFTTVFCGYGIAIADARRWGVYFVWLTQFNYWGTEAHYNEILKVYENVFASDLTNAVYGFTLNRTILDFIAMALIGLGWRVAAYFAMISFNKEKQR
jgi:ABC-type multidrug transport system ATPase subunit